MCIFTFILYGAGRWPSCKTPSALRSTSCSSARWGSSTRTRSPSAWASSAGAICLSETHGNCNSVLCTHRAFYCWWLRAAQDAWVASQSREEQQRMTERQETLNPWIKALPVRIDIWVMPWASRSDLMLQLQLSYMLSRDDFWTKQSYLRVCSIVGAFCPTTVRCSHPSLRATHLPCC